MMRRVLRNVGKGLVAGIYCIVGIPFFFLVMTVGLAGLILQNLSEHGLRALNWGWDAIDSAW